MYTNATKWLASFFLLFYQIHEILKSNYGTIGTLFQGLTAPYISF